MNTPLTPEDAMVYGGDVPPGIIFEVRCDTDARELAAAFRYAAHLIATLADTLDAIGDVLTADAVRSYLRD